MDRSELIQLLQDNFMDATLAAFFLSKTGHPVSSKTLRQWGKRNKIPIVKIGYFTLYYLPDLQNFRNTYL